MAVLSFCPNHPRTSDQIISQNFFCKMSSMSCTPPSVDITLADFARSKTAMYHDDDGELTCVYHVVETQHYHRLKSSRRFSHAGKQKRTLVKACSLRRYFSMKFLLTLWVCDAQQSRPVRYISRCTRHNMNYGSTRRTIKYIQKQKKLRTDREIRTRVYIVSRQFWPVRYISRCARHKMN